MSKRPDPLTLIKRRWSALPPGQWRSCGPVRRDALMLGLCKGLSEEVYEVAQADNEIPPGICVVNKYFRPSTDDGPPQRWTAEKLAEGLAAAPDDVRWLISEVERLRRKVAP